ncbi:serine hydrolase [Labrenzia sp. PHM005]|uniref:serine hydrolase domain-containing protein n=1 Tax=Labrenzia sp. PHM005 TaxID=2590016 RepID=UPI0011401E4B|nr:serine hydrolase [Labrenzia sp. PHM005]QDG75605.1 serine hydrolase [Labrenzia sp. PHM005]
MTSAFFRVWTTFLSAIVLAGVTWHAAIAGPAPRLCEPQGTTQDRPDDVPIRIHALDESPDQLDDGLPVSTLAAEGFSIAPIKEMVADLQNGTYRNVDGVLIARHGKLVFEGYFNGFDRSTKHETRSAFKSITSTLTGIALDQELISGVDVPISRFFQKNWPAASGDRELKDAITLADMLTMTPGFDAEEAFGAGPWRETAMWAAEDWIRFSLDIPMADQPGRQFRYSSATTFLIGVAVARAASLPLPEFAKANLFEPLGISNYCWTLSPKGHAIGMGSFYMLPRDMLKIGQLFLDGGSWNGRQIVSKEWVGQATQHLVDAVPPGTQSEKPATSGYGYQWWTYTPRSFEDPRVAYFFASGNGGQEIFVFPKLDMVVVFTGSNYDSPIAHRQPIQILNRSIFYSVL